MCHDKSGPYRAWDGHATLIPILMHYNCAVELYHDQLSMYNKRATNWNHQKILTRIYLDRGGAEAKNREEEEIPATK